MSRGRPGLSAAIHGCRSRALARDQPAAGAAEQPRHADDDRQIEPHELTAARRTETAICAAARRARVVFPLPLARAITHSRLRAISRSSQVHYAHRRDASGAGSGSTRGQWRSQGCSPQPDSLTHRRPGTGHDLQGGRCGDERESPGCGCRPIWRSCVCATSGGCSARRWCRCWGTAWCRSRCRSPC